MALNMLVSSYISIQDPGKALGYASAGTKASIVLCLAIAALHITGFSMPWVECWDFKAVPFFIEPGDVGDPSPGWPFPFTYGAGACEDSNLCEHLEFFWGAYCDADAGTSRNSPCAGLKHVFSNFILSMVGFSIVHGVAILPRNFVGLLVPRCDL